MSRARDVANFIPTGGAAGEVLAKASAADYDLEWATGGGGGGNPPAYGGTPPATPAVGDLWYKTTEAVGLYIYTDDGSSQQWVQTNGSADGAPGADGAGFPTGGNTDDILKKIDNVDDNVKWENEIHGGNY